MSFFHIYHFSARATANVIAKASAFTDDDGDDARAMKNASRKNHCRDGLHKFLEGYPVWSSKKNRACLVTYRQSGSELFEMSFRRGSNVNNL